MIVYASKLDLRDPDPRVGVHKAMQEWLRLKTRREVGEAQIRQGRHELGFDHTLEVEEFAFTEEAPPANRPPEEDWAVAYRYSHPDREVRGRRWITEVGLTVVGRTWSCCTVVLRTEEQSALALAPVQTTRPGIVQFIRANCALRDTTPGQSAAQLTLGEAAAVRDRIRDRDRRHPLVLISHHADGGLNVDPQRLAERCLGIANVVLIPTAADTVLLEQALGSGLCPYRGAVDILWPLANADDERRVPRTRLLPEQFDEMRNAELDPTSEVLARICHETNHRVASWHETVQDVRALRLRLELDLATERLARSAGPEEMELLRLYREFEADDKRAIAGLKNERDELQTSLVSERARRSEAEQRAATLESRLQRTRQPAATLTPEQVRDAIGPSMHARPTLSESLAILEHFFPDRLVVLPTAHRSARDASRFRRPKAFELLWKLCTGYYQAMVEGGGDKKAIQVFGSNSFAASESETVENNKRARSLRTFLYRGEPVEMMRHLKIGVKPSDAETFRAHFHWDAQNQRVVIGHCGGHLDHD